MNHLYTCPHCLKKYKIKLYFVRHVTACELIFKTDREYIRDDVLAIPNMKKMYDMIIEIARKNNQLERKVEKLTRLLNHKKKRLYIKEWLDKNYNETVSLETFTSDTVLDAYDFDSIKNTNFIDGINIIFKRRFLVRSQIPIQAFEQKENILFVKDHTEWRFMTCNDLSTFIGHILKQLMSLFVSWQETNVDKLHHSSYQEEYITTLQKILVNPKDETLVRKIKRNLYNQIKLNFITET
jgi:hypothetical protein